MGAWGGRKTSTSPQTIDLLGLTQKSFEDLLRQPGWECPSSCPVRHQFPIDALARSPLLSSCHLSRASPKNPLEDALHYRPDGMDGLPGLALLRWQR